MRFAHLVGQELNKSTGHGVNQKFVKELIAFQSDTARDTAKIGLTAQCTFSSIDKLDFQHIEAKTNEKGDVAALQSSNQRSEPMGAAPVKPAVPLSCDLTTAPLLEIKSLTKSDSCPTTPLKGTVASVVGDKNTIECVNTDFVGDSHIPSALHLPYHMERLLELFRTCETLVSTLHNRSEVCSFDKIKPAVQEVIRW